MDSSIRGHARRLLRASKSKSQYVATLAFVSVFVVLAVVGTLTRRGISMVVPQQVLDCHYTGSGAHTHDASCYDEAGNLVCPLTEREYHVHDDSCYTETRDLACGLEEHTHTDACYDEEGNLTCGIAEHIHTDACYKVTRELTCGKQETAETHVHGPGCFRTVMVEDGTSENGTSETAGGQQVTGQDVDPTNPVAAEGQETGESAMPAQTFAHQFEDQDHNVLLRVDVSAPEGALPAGSTMRAEWVDPTTLDATTQKVVNKAIAKAADGKVLDRQAVDITFLDAQGVEIEPALEVTVTFASPLVATKDQPVVVHIDDSEETLKKTKGKPKAEAVAALDEQELEKREVTLAEDELAFDSDQFSTYVLALTSLQYEMRSTDGKTVSVTVDAPAEAGIPADAVIRVTEIAPGSQEYTAYASQAAGALGAGERDVALARFFDIKIEGADGQEIQPAAPVQVKIELADAPAEAEGTGVVHFANDGATEVVEAQATGDTTTFDATGFSVYGVVYTVDFHWSVNGQTADYSIDGGGVLSMRELLVALGMVDASEVDELVAGIANVEFSDPSLVAATKLGEDMTAEAIAQALAVEPVYSAALTEKQVAELKAQQFAAGDWVLATLSPFDTNEKLTVTMDNGDAFEIAVTDARLEANVLTADGEKWKITVEYDEAAEIPAGATLEAREIVQGSEEYEGYLRDAAARMGLTGSDIKDARFFDIEILADGQKVEPKVPVQVNIKHDDALDVAEDATLSVIHFADKGTEVIRNVELSEDGTEVAYEQASFSVTGTIVGAPTGNGQQRMVLVKDGNRYYIVNNDGSLTEVGYDEAKNEVTVADPMLWTIDTNNGTHIYFNSEATGFGTNQIASDYYRRYLDPTSSTGTTEENSSNVTVQSDGTWNNDGVTVETNHVSDRGTMLNNTSLTINNGKVSHNGTYFTIKRDADGNPVSLEGTTDSSAAADFLFATASKLPSGLHLDNCVNHIDISIEGTAGVTVPLAYGDYYGVGGYDPNSPDHNVIRTVTENTKLELGEAQMVDPTQLKITAEDMKRATITAYDQSGNELDDVFYINGFSANTTTAYSTVQVRIEGKFMVADLRGTQYEHVDSTRYDGNFWTWPPQWPDGNYVNAVRRARLNNIIDYTVTVVKPLTYYLKDENGNQLYDHDGNAMTVTVDVAFSGSFNYWDSGNECPPIQGNADWRAGDIPNHDMSGMDFKLGGNAENPDNPLVAIEITKIVMNDEGERIELKTPITNTFDIYENTTANRNGVAGYDVDSYQGQTPQSVYDGYHYLHSRNITVDEKGMSLIYDYRVTNAMYYIVEHSDEESLPETVMDEEGREWTYEKTYFETEYVRRGDQYDDRTQYPNPMHVSDEYTRGDGSYASIPEVAGKFTDLKGEERKSGFLEFYVYNIYSSGKKLPVEKKWTEGTIPPTGTMVKAQLLYRTRMIKNDSGASVTPGEWPATYSPAVKGQGGFDNDLVTELTLTADGDWKGQFENLPKTITIDGAVYEVDYSAEESSVMLNNENILGEYETSSEVVDGTVVFTNDRESTKLDVIKEWASETDVPEGAEVTVELYYKARKIMGRDGHALETPGDWSNQVPVEGSALFDHDPLCDETQLVTKLTLSAGNNWTGSFTSLPKTLIDAADDTYEVDYLAVETSVKVPDESGTLVDATDRYVATTVKTDAAGAAAETSDGSVTVTNAKKTVTPTVEKAWDPTPTDSTAYAKVQLKRYKKSQPMPTVSETIVKVWEDSNNADGARPESLTVTLSGGDEFQTVTLNEANGWTATIDNLPKYADNEHEQEITYTWTEPEVTNYRLVSAVTEGTTTTLTNQYKKTSATVTKVWDDAENQDGKRPEGLTATLSNGTQVELNESNGWSATVSDLNAFTEQGEPIAYTWTEPTLASYVQSDVTTEGTVTTFTNTHVPETTSATFSLVWDDQEDKDGSRPQTVTVALSNGQTVTLNAANQWTATIDNLPKYANGEEISYTWTAPTIDGYEKRDESTEGTTTTLTYFHQPPEKDTVTVTLNTILGEGLPSDWAVNIYNITVNGEAVSGAYMNNYGLRPISFEVPKNAKIRYHYATATEGIKLNTVTSQEVYPKSTNEDSNNGSRDIMFSAGTRDVVVYHIVSGSNATDLPEQDPPEPKYMNVTVNLTYLDGYTNTFGWNAPTTATYQQQNPYHDFGFSLTQQAGQNTWKKDGASVQNDFDETITYAFNGSFWNMGQNDMLVISSPDAQLTGTLEYESNGNYAFDLVAKEGDVTINVTVGPKSALQGQSTQSVSRSAKLMAVPAMRKVLAASSGMLSPEAPVNTSANNDIEATIHPMLSQLASDYRLAAATASPTLRAAGNSSSSSSAPDGYHEDTKFTAKNITLTLNATDGWIQSFPVQDKYDENGEEYIYFVEETACAPEDYQLTSSEGDILSSSGVKLTNTKENNTGDLELTKKVAGDGDANKQFVFTITLTPPAGETLDTSYEAKMTSAQGVETSATATLTDAGEGTYQVAGIQLKADEKYTIVGLPSGTAYTVTEGDYSADGYSSAPTSGTSLTGTIPDGESAKASVEVTNTFNPGTLTIEKLLSGNATDANKDFSFEVEFVNSALAGATKGSWKKGTPETIDNAETTSITFDADGKATVTFVLKGGEQVVFSKLPVGTTFTAKENSADQDGYETTVATDGGELGENKTVTGVIAASSSITASFTNSKSETQAEATKAWKSGEENAAWPADVASVEFTLYKTVNEVTSKVTADDVAEIVNPVTITAEAESKTAAWTGLPGKYLVDGTWYEAAYSVVETKVTYTEAAKSAGATDLTDVEAIEQAFGATYDADAKTITNVIPQVDVTATKKWRDKDGTVLTGSDIPTGAKVTFTLLIDGEVSQRAVELDGVDETADGATPEGADYEGAHWIAYFTGLPKYNAQGQPISYTVKETGTWTGFAVEGNDTVSSGETITNKEKSIDLEILKVDSDGMTEPLAGAKFELHRLDENDSSKVSYAQGAAGEAVDPATDGSDHKTGDDGKATFAGLTTGYYEVSETHAPEGYVLTGESTFYIKVEDGVISLLAKEEGKAPKEWTAGEETDTFEFNAEANPPTAKIGNTPGKELPSAGGPGTTFTLLVGTAMIAGAALTLIRRLGAQEA